MLVNAETGELFIYQPIGADFFGDGITAEAVIVALETLGGKRATVRINSPGGVADEGIAIYNALKRYEGGVDTVVDALAASAASVIALAGENRTTASGGRWMIHRAMTIAMGNAMDMQKVAETLNKYDQSLVEIYAEHMTDSDNESIMALLTAETWYSGTEAIEAGLATGDANEAATQPNVANWFRNAPEAVYKEAVAAINQPKFPVHRQAAALLAKNYT